MHNRCTTEYSPDPHPLITIQNESQPMTIVPSVPTFVATDETTHLDTKDQNRFIVSDIDNVPSYQEAMKTSKIDLKSQN